MMRNPPRLPLPRVASAHRSFRNPPVARHDLARLGLVAEKELKPQQLRVVEIRADMAREGGRFEELHILKHTLNAYGLQRSDPMRSRGAIGRRTGKLEEAG